MYFVLFHIFLFYIFNLHLFKNIHFVLIMKKTHFTSFEFRVLCFFSLLHGAFPNHHHFPNLTLILSYSPPDSSRFDSSGNLSLASSQLSSEPEEHRDPAEIRPSFISQPSTWEEQDEELEKELQPQPEPGSNKDFEDSSVILHKPMLENHNNTQTKIWYVKNYKLIIIV